MSLDPLLVDSIKAHFARKSSAQLREIVQSKDETRWSAEALAAAGELLQDRAAGRAHEPEMPDEDSLPPYHYDPNLLALGLLGGLSGGRLMIPYERQSGAPRLGGPLGFVALAAHFLIPEVESAFE